MSSHTINNYFTAEIQHNIIADSHISCILMHYIPRADTENGARNALVVIVYDGTIHWVPHRVYRSSCSIDVTNFPFDEQQCHMWFGSWTHTLPDIDMQLSFNGGIDLSTFQSDYKVSVR